MIYTCVYEAKLGNIKISADEKSILTVSFTDETVNSFNKSIIIKNAISQLNEYFEGTRSIFDLQINPTGTVFQKKVWNELLKIPYGKTRTYKDIALSLGNAKSYRAVGNACNKNPIAIIIPCHRVIGRNDKLIGFAYGINLKKQLLEHENTKKENQ